MSVVPEPLRFLAFFNPLAILIAAFQDILYFGRFPDWRLLLALLGFSCVVLWLAAIYFNRQKATFAEAL